MKSPIDPAMSLVDELLLIRSDGSETRLTIRIGLPVKRGDDWACPCEVAGLEAQYPDITGVNPIQAMSLALRLVRSRLSSVVENVLCLPNDRRPLSVRFVNAWFGAD